MAWPELKKAKKNAENIGNEVSRLLRESNSLSKKEMSQHAEKLIADFDDSVEVIEDQVEELRESLESHRKYIRSKRRFLKRHYKSL